MKLGRVLVISLLLFFLSKTCNDEGDVVALFRHLQIEYLSRLEIEISPMETFSCC